MEKSSPTGIQKAVMIKKAKELQKMIMKASLYKSMKNGSK